MSAFVVGKAHLDYLVTAAIELGVIEPDRADAIGRELHEENCRSVDHRYRETNERESYAFTRSPKAIAPVQVLQACACLDYQSCEHPGWTESPARALLDAIEGAALARLAPRLREVTRDCDGWERPRWKDTPEARDAEWEIREVPA